MNTVKRMFLMLKDKPVLSMDDDGTSRILDYDRLPFALRKESVSLMEFMEWASGRTLPIGRSYAKEILNTLRLSQNNRFAVCKACRGLSLSDSYWIRQEEDQKAWEEVNLFKNPLMLYISEVSLSGRVLTYGEHLWNRKGIHTPELTTQGASAKSWIRDQEGILRLHKVGKYEIPADQILTALGIPHISYEVSRQEEIDRYLSPERKEWLEGVGEVMVNSRIFTSEDRSFVPFEDFRIYCENHGKNPYEETRKIDREMYLNMQVADYILGNFDRHEQNWGFLGDNETGKIKGFCPLFDHDRSFSAFENEMSQTTEQPMTLHEAAAVAQREAGLDLKDGLKRIQEGSSFTHGADIEGKPTYLEADQWEQVLRRLESLAQ